jgi:hypothetical protein
MKQIIQPLTIFTLIIFVLSCNIEEDKVRNELLANSCYAINDFKHCGDDELKRIEESLNLGDYSLPKLYYHNQMYIQYLDKKYNSNSSLLEFSEFCERLNLSNIALLKFGTWTWVKEESPYGTIIPSDRGYSETRFFESSFQERTLNDSSPKKSRFTLIGDLIKSTDSTGYETIERIIKLTVDTLVIRIDKFQNTKTYINEQLFINNLDYSKKLSNPSRRDIDIYHHIASSIEYSKPPLNVKSIKELTNENGVSWSTSSGRIYSDGSPFTGYAYDRPAYKDKNDIVKIFKVKDGYKDGFQIKFISFFLRKPQYLKIYESSFYNNGYLTGRINRYSPIESQPLRIVGSSFYVYGVKISCDGSNCDDL